MSDRFYLQQYKLTFSLQPDRRHWDSETPTYYKQIQQQQQQKREIKTQNPAHGKIYIQNNEKFIFINGKGFIKISELKF